MTRIVGHEAVYDNMGIAGLTHPTACATRYSGADCPVSKAITAGRIYGYQGRGSYQVTLDDSGDAHLWARPDVPATLQAAMATEVEDLLDAYLDEVGKYSGFSVIVRWMQERGAIL